MYKLLKDERGLSLVVAIVFMVIAGILISALMSSSVHNIIFGQNELDQKRAFYAAEAGVEHTLSYMKEEGSLFEGKESIEYESIPEEIKYEIEQVEDFHFVSTGKVYEEGTENILQSQRIEFDLDIILKGTEVLLDKYNIPVFYQAKESHTSGGQNEPGEGPKWEDKWYKVYNWDMNSDFEEGDIVYYYDDDEEEGNYYEVVYEEVENVNDDSPGDNEGLEDDPDGIIDTEFEAVEIWQLYEDYGTGDLVINPVNLRGQEDEFSRDSITLTSKETSWQEFLEEYYDEYEFEQGDSDENRKEIKNKEWEYFSDDVEFGEDIYDWSKEKEFDEDDIVFHNYEYYKSIEDHEAKKDNEPGEGNEWTEYWDEVEDGDLDFQSVDIINSVIIVHGSITLRGGVNLENTLILVKNDVDLGGGGGGQKPNFNESLILSFNENVEDKPVITTGTPSITVDLTRSTFQDWPLIEDYIPHEALTEDIVNWRPR